MHSVSNRDKLGTCLQSFEKQIHILFHDVVQRLKQFVCTFLKTFARHILYMGNAGELNCSYSSINSCASLKNDARLRQSI